MKLSPETEEFRQQIRRFVEKEVEPRSRWIEEHDAIPDDLMAKARELGLFGITIPEEYGGRRARPRGQVRDRGGARARATMGSRRSSPTIPVSARIGIVTLGSEALKRKYLPRMATGEWVGCFALTEPQAGSDPAAMRTTAVRKGDRYVLNGEKIFITNAGIAQVFTVMAITDKTKGIKGISAFVVERGFPGFPIGKNELKMGMHGCHHRAAGVHRLRGAGGEPARRRGDGLRPGLEDAHARARNHRGAQLRHHGQADRALHRLHEDAHAGRQEARRVPGPAVDARRHGGQRGTRRGSSRSARSKR